MKLYNTQLDIAKINTKRLAEYLSDSRNVSYIYSDECVLRIYDNRDLHSIVIQDGALDILENYVNNQTFVIDHTIIKKQKQFISHIPNNHVKKDYKVKYYLLREKSPITMVMEVDYQDRIYDVYFMLRDTYAAYSDADIHNPFIKEDIEMFCDIIK